MQDNATLDSANMTIAHSAMEDFNGAELMDWPIIHYKIMVRH